LGDKGQSKTNKERKEQIKMKKIDTPADKGKVTTAIRAFLDAKAAKEAAEKEMKKRSAELLEIMDGDKTAEWTSDDGRKYALTATYGKTRSTLSKDLIEKLLHVVVTDECYTVSKPWNELRVAITA
jgi:hypothetical protein